MLWPLPGVVRDKRLDEVIIDGRAVWTGHFATVIAEEVEPLMRHHQSFLAAVALRMYKTKKPVKADDGRKYARHNINLLTSGRHFLHPLPNSSNVISLE